MAKKAPAVVDYSKLTLSEVIKRKAKRKCLFTELESLEKREVLDYIKNHDIPVRVFGKRWFDILSQQFFVEEFTASEENFYGVNKDIYPFDSFSDFYKFLNGDIYNESCYFGYTFSDEEINKFSLKIENLNFDSFLSETIDNYCFENLQKLDAENTLVNASRAKEMFKWLSKHANIDSYEDIEYKLRQFTEKFNIWDAKYIFFSYLLRTQKDNIKDFFIKFVCESEPYLGAKFDDVLINYGREAARYVIDNYEGGCSYSTKTKRIRIFKNSLMGYDSGTYQLYRKITYDKDYQLYVVKDRYYNNENYGLDIKNFFLSFFDLTNFVGGDFKGADFLYAPIDEYDIKKYQTDENTKLPLKHNYKKYLIKKFFGDGKFCVEQSWQDENGITIKTHEKSFKKFCNFVHFLKNDLSGADFLMCEGIENIKSLKNLNINNIKVRSEIANILDLKINYVPENTLAIKEFYQSASYELQTIDSFELERIDDNDYSNRVSYISDIHLLHRFQAYHCESIEDINYTIRILAKSLAANDSMVNLIAGDTSSNFEMFKIFMNELVDNSKGKFFFTLGNHEFWDSTFLGKSPDEIVNEYRKYADNETNKKLYLVHNNLYYLLDCEWKEITTDELISISSEKLREKMRGARLIIFGGLGFAGCNDAFNASAGLYSTILNRDQEINLSNMFYGLYEKVTESLKGMNLIVMTHMPMKDWGGDIHAKEGVVYINGHSHRNYFYDDGKKRIYADNQIGYKGRKVNFKTFSIDFSYNWFLDYEDGIYEISKLDYEKFYRGIGEALTFNRDYTNLYMIKREETYMFLMRTLKGTLLILNGGSIRKAGDHDLEYFYDNLVKYSSSVSMFLSKFDEAQKIISSEVRRIGGSGNIHGSIIDINFNNHIYINPLDGTITPYFAYSMVDKYVYSNIASLLKYECPDLYRNYEKQLTQNNGSNALSIYKSDLETIKDRVYVESTEIYKISRILKGLQFTTKYNVVRLWNDNFVDTPSEENGRLIVSGIIDPDSVPQVVESKKKPKINRPKREKQPKIVLTPEEIAEKKFIKYKEKISQETSTIEVVEYINSTTKATYRCKICGYEWSTRPDHFKDRQNYKCPNCKK